jgi:TFIIF-interacting CTD phosphatase-like protein
MSEIKETMIRKGLVLDLDETLIYATTDYKSTERKDNYDFKVTLDTPETYYIYKRTDCDALIKLGFELYRVVIWTASDKGYALPIINKLFPDKNMQPEFILYGQQCSYKYSNINYESETGNRITKIKNLKKVKQKLKISLEKIVIVDDKYRNCLNNYSNAVIVSEYTGNIQDSEFADLMIYLQYLSTVENIRSINKRDWRNQITCTDKIVL